MMKIFKNVMFCFLVFFSFLIINHTNVFAYDAEDLARYNRTRNCPRCDLSKANLKNFIGVRGDLRDANLSGADFSGARLHGTNFTNANLRGAKFLKADLTVANLSGADCTGANFQGSNNSHIKFNNAILRNTDFSNTKKNYLPSSNLIGIDIRGMKGNIDFLTKLIRTEREQYNIKSKFNLNLIIEKNTARDGRELAKKFIALTSAQISLFQHYVHRKKPSEGLVYLRKVMKIYPYKAIKALNAMAKEGYPLAQYALGISFMTDRELIVLKKISALSEKKYVPRCLWKKNHGYVCPPLFSVIKEKRKKDLFKAVHWIELAAKEKYPLAIKNLPDIKKRLRLELEKEGRKKIEKYQKPFRDRRQEKLKRLLEKLKREKAEKDKKLAEKQREKAEKDKKELEKKRKLLEREKRVLKKELDKYKQELKKMGKSRNKKRNELLKKLDDLEKKKRELKRFERKLDQEKLKRLLEKLKREKAEQDKKEAEKQKELAEKQKKEAEDRSRLDQKQREKAEKDKKLAEKKAMQEKFLRLLEEKKKELAEKDKKIAEDKSRLDQKKREKAEKDKKKAEKQKELAEKKATQEKFLRLLEEKKKEKAEKDKKEAEDKSRLDQKKRELAEKDKKEAEKKKLEAERLKELMALEALKLRLKEKKRKDRYKRFSGNALFFDKEHTIGDKIQFRMIKVDRFSSIHSPKSFWDREKVHPPAGSVFVGVRFVYANSTKRAFSFYRPLVATLLDTSGTVYSQHKKATIRYRINHDYDEKSPWSVRPEFRHKTGFVFTVPKSVLKQHDFLVEINFPVLDNPVKAKLE